MHLHDEKLVDALVQTLEATDMFQVEERAFEVKHYAGNLDCLLHVSTPAGNKVIAVEFKREAYPRDVRNAVWQLESFRKDNPALNNLVLMLAAEHISEGAKEDLRHHGVAYFDTSGTLYLKQKNWLIDIQRPAKPLAKRHATQLFTEAREQVVHALLHYRNRYLSGLELAELSATSTYTVSTVLSELERLEWIVSEGSGRTLRRKLSRPGELLDAWAEAWIQRRDNKSRWYFYTPNPAQTIASIAERMHDSKTLDGIFTGAAAANLIDPHLTRTDIVDLIISPGEADGYVEMLKLKPAEKGANLTLIERSGASRLFVQPSPPFLPNVAFASPFILYLDLLNGKGRNKELAAQLRQNTLKI